MTDSPHQSRAQTEFERPNDHPVNGVQARSVYDDIRLEVERSILKHGHQLRRPFGTGAATHPLEFASRSETMDASKLSELAKAFVDEATGAGNLTWQRILMEEVMEAAAADELDDLRSELVQVAAVAVKFIVAVDVRQQLRAYVR